jgi:enterochelin esterase family protein
MQKYATTHALLIAVASCIFAATSAAAQQSDEDAKFAQQMRSVFPGIPDQDMPAFKRDGGHYKRAPEFNVRQDVTKGVVTEHSLADSKVYPGVPHQFWTYVPADYDKSKSACVMIFLDGRAFLGTNPNPNFSLQMPVLMDNLIHDKQIPIMVGVFVAPGKNGPGMPIYGGNNNRSIEYDSTNEIMKISPNFFRKSCFRK